MNKKHQTLIGRNKRRKTRFNWTLKWAIGLIIIAQLLNASVLVASASKQENSLTDSSSAEVSEESLRVDAAAQPISTRSEGGVTYLGSLGGVATKSSDTELVINTEQSITSGDDIVIAVATDPNANMVVSVDDAAGNSYEQIGDAVVNTGELRTYLFVAYDVNSMPTGSTIVVTIDPAVTSSVAIAALFSGLTDSDAFDLTSSGTDTGTEPTSGATSTTTQADELLIGLVGTEGPEGDDSGTWGDSFEAGPRLGTTGDDDDSNATISMGYRIVSTTGTYSASKSGITERDWTALIATFAVDVSTESPKIYTSGTPLSEFASLPGQVSDEQSYYVSGDDLTGAITITAPADFEISLTSGSDFTSVINLEPTGGEVAATPIYVRFNRVSEGTSSGSLVHESSGATTRSIPISGVSAQLNPVDFNIMLACPTDESILVNIIPDYDVEFYIEYGINSGSYTDQTTTYTATADEVIEFTIEGLSANTDYFYRIIYRRTSITEWNTGEEHSFITQRDEGSSFTFTIVSDSHLGQYGGNTEDEYALYEQTLLNVLADDPDFHIDLGDTYAMDPSPLGTGMTLEEAMAAYYIERPYLGLITDSIPYFQIIGNHENEEGWNFDDVFDDPDQSLAIVGMTARKYYIPIPTPDDFYTGNTDPLDEPIGGDTYHEDYYAWEWGDVLFVVLDPFHYSMTWPDDEGEGYGGEGQDGEESGDRWDWTLGIEQYLWLKETLENSDATYKFVFSHHVTGGITPYGRGGISAAAYFEWGGYNADGTWGWDDERPAEDGWDVPVHQLMVENDVDVFFHGHDHIYSYEELDGIVYLECPKPDDAGYDWEPYGYGYNENLYPDGVNIPNSGYIRVSVTSEVVTVEYVRSYLEGDGENGVVAHSFTITAEETGMLGDINGDNAVNSTDALIAFTGDVGYDVSDFCPMYFGDVNDDGFVNSTDALIILSYDAGFSVPYSLGEWISAASEPYCTGCDP